MKLDTAIVFSKGIAHVLVGVFTPWSAALAQWINSGEWPSRIVWIGVILPSSVVGGASAWNAFVSGAWQEYHVRQIAPANPAAPESK